MSVATAAFWVSAGLAGYTYVGYPVLVALLAELRRPPRPPLPDEHELPEVTIVMAAYNECVRLPAKLRNLWSLDYPARLVRVIVVSDGSTDGTELVAAGDPRLRMLVSAQRRGKAHALNLALREVRSEVVVFCDVRQDLDPGCVRRLVGDLRQPGVGVVSGELVHRPGATQTGRSIGLYWRYEKWIRKSESRLYSTVGATGALYAMRSDDWCELPEGTILDDFDNPMQVVRRGKRAMFEPAALAWDTLQEDSATEQRRKIRTLIGNFQSFAQNPWLFSPRENPIWFQFVSHKVLRLFVPYALAVALFSSLWVPGAVYRLAFAAQLVFYLLAAAGRWVPPSRRLRLVSFAHVFVDMNLAAVLALGRFVRGRVDARWEKTA